MTKKNTIFGQSFTSNCVCSGANDIDNRLKVLVDGLKMPRDCSQLPAKWPSDPEQHDLLYCLMEDDDLITEIKVTSDRLLTPPAEDERRNDVELLIHVTTKISKRVPLAV